MYVVGISNVRSLVAEYKELKFTVWPNQWALSDREISLIWLIPRCGFEAKPGSFENC